MHDATSHHQPTPADAAAPADPATSATEVASSAATAVAPIVEVTPAALASVLEIRAGEVDPETLGLRIEITGTRGVEFTYDLAFDELDNAEPDDHIDESQGVPVVVPAESVDRLRGAVLDVPRVAGQGGLVIRNPNRPNPLDDAELTLEGTIAEKVETLLDERINPSLAAHGGFATLVGVDDDNQVFITMGGGCQGCAMSRMTLTDGIDRSIRDAIPEVTAVLDATDHTAGENPFY